MVKHRQPVRAEGRGGTHRTWTWALSIAHHAHAQHATGGADQPIRATLLVRPSYAADYEQQNEHSQGPPPTLKTEARALTCQGERKKVRLTARGDRRVCQLSAVRNRQPALPQVSAPGGIRTPDLLIRSQEWLSAVLPRVCAAHEQADRRELSAVVHYAPAEDTPVLRRMSAPCRRVPDVGQAPLPQERCQAVSRIARSFPAAQGLKPNSEQQVRGEGLVRAYTPYARSST